MSKCQPITGLKLDASSLAAIKRIKHKTALGKKLATVISTGVVTNIFVNNKAPVAMLNISQTDWGIYAQVMKSIPAITKAATRKEIELMVLHYEMNFNYKHLQFWKGMYYGCNQK